MAPSGLQKAALIRRIISVSNVEASQLEGIPCHEWYSVLLGSTQLCLLVSTRLGTWFFLLLPTRLET